MLLNFPNGYAGVESKNKMPKENIFKILEFIINDNAGLLTKNKMSRNKCENRMLLNFPNCDA